MLQKLFGGKPKTEPLVSEPVKKETSKKPKIPAIEKPSGHANYDEKEKEKCPYFQINQKLAQDGTKDIERSPLVKETKTKKPKGGCPFMVSDKKKNPPLGAMEELYDANFVSKYAYLFEYRGYMSLGLEINEAEQERYLKREVFEAYPMYLKHTLMHEDEDMKKVRALEIAQRFFVYDKFRERGNKEFYKGDFDTALAYYERSLGCFRWLEYKELDPLPKQPVEEEIKQDEERKSDETEEETVVEEEDQGPQMTEKEKEEMKQIQENLKKEKEEMRKKYKSMMKSYCDENVKLMDGQELTDSSDIDMRRSMVQTILMILGITYMKLGHFRLAHQAIEDALKIHDKSSLLFYRKSQALSYSKSATIQELTEAKEAIEKAISMKNYEKIFQSEKGILKIMNLENHEEAYIEQAQFATRRLHERKQWELERIRKVMARERQLQDIEKRMMEEGKTPISIQKEQKGEICDEIDEEQMMPWDIISEMVRKYYRAVEFYGETDKPDQVKLAKQELQNTLETFRDMEYYYFGFDFTKPNELIELVNQEMKIDFSNPRFVRRAQRLGRDFAKDVFEKGHYNFEMYKYAIDDYFKKKKEERDRLEKEQKENEPEQVKSKHRIASKIFSLETMIQLVVLMMIVVTFVYYNKDTSFFKDILIPMMNSSQKK